MKNFVPVLILSLIPFASLFAQDDSSGYHFKKYFADSAYSSIVIEHDTIEGYEVLNETTRTQSYHLAHYWVGDDEKTILIPETSIQTVLSSADGEEGIVKLSARISEGGAFNKTLWSKTVDGNQTVYEYDYLEVDQYGCCGAANTKELLRYTDGARLLLLSSDLGIVSIPNNRSKRYIGFLGDDAVRGYDDIHDSLLCSVLTYMDPVSLRSQRVLISYKDPKMVDSLGPGAFEKITFTPTVGKDRENYHGGNILDLWSGEGKADSVGYSGFTIDLHAYGGDPKMVLRIPIANDGFDISKVRSNVFNVALR
jgi:hypothetical protein